MQQPTTEQLEQYRRHLSVFVTFTDEEWMHFAGHLYVRHLQRKELLVKSGEICTEIGFITAGAVRFFFLKDGLEISSYFCFEQELVTSYGSFLQAAPSMVSIEALENTTIICYTQKGLQTMMEDALLAPKMERFGRLVAEYLICCYEERLLSFLTNSPEERYLNLIERGSAFLQRVPQHQVANFLGVTPVSLSRIRKRVFNKRKKTILNN